MDISRRMISRQRTSRLETYDPYVYEITDRRNNLQVVHKSKLLPVLPFLFVRSVYLLLSMTLIRTSQIANYRLSAFGIKHSRFK